jgi:hypothetical protein
VVAGLRATSLRRLAQQRAGRLAVWHAIAILGWMTGVAFLSVYRGRSNPRGEHTVPLRIDFGTRRMDLELRRQEEEISRKRGAPLGDEERIWRRAREPAPMRAR